MMPPDVLAFIKANADEYRRVARIVDCTVRYPRDNQCARCERVSPHALAPDNKGWLCRICAYPTYWRDNWRDIA